MRAFWVFAVVLAACGDDSEGDPKDFIDQGGQREIDDCGYTLMTRIGAEAPYQAARPAALAGRPPAPGRGVRPPSLPMAKALMVSEPALRV